MAALTFGIPVRSVTIDDRPRLLRGDYTAHDESFALEAVVVLCLSGPESELEFCGPIADDGDRFDYAMARRYLARRIANPLQAAAELARYRDAAQRLVRSPWGRQRITVIAEALLRHGNLTGDDIAHIAAP